MEGEGVRGIGSHLRESEDTGGAALGVGAAFRGGREVEQWHPQSGSGDGGREEAEHKVRQYGEQGDEAGERVGGGEGGPRRRPAHGVEPQAKFHREEGIEKGGARQVDRVHRPR